GSSPSSGPPRRNGSCGPCAARRAASNGAESEICPCQPPILPASACCRARREDEMKLLTICWLVVLAAAAAAGADQIHRLPLPANDLVYDRVRQRIYAST